MKQEGALWPNSMIRLWQDWRRSNKTWANIVNAVLDLGNENISILAGAVKIQDSPLNKLSNGL